MPQGLLAHDQLQHSAAADLTRQWVGGIGLAALVGFGYFLAAAFSVRLVLEPEGVAVFWPAAGLSSGLLIALGPRARWPVLAGVIVATTATHLIIKDPLGAGIAFGLCNGAEALITAGLIHHYFAPDFNLTRLRNVIGLLAAAIAGTTMSDSSRRPNPPPRNCWCSTMFLGSVPAVAAAIPVVRVANWLPV